METKLPSPSKLPLTAKCPASFRQCADLPNISSEASIEGSLAHRAGELVATGVEPDPIKLAAEFAVSVELAESAIGRQWFLWKLKDSGWDIYAENRLSINIGSYTLVGSPDLVAISPDKKTMLVADQKSGRLEVDPPDRNLQLIAYAIGAIDGIAGTCELETIKTTIIYSRFGHAVECIWTPAELLAWMPTIQSVIERAIGTHANFNPGIWCANCSACPTCPATHQLMAQVQNGEVSLIDLREVSNEKKVELFALWKIAEKFAKQAEKAFKTEGVAPIRFEDGKIWGPVESPRKEAKPREAWPHLSDLCGDHWPDAVKLGNEALETAAILRAEECGDVARGYKSKAKKALWDTLREFNALDETTITKFTVHREGEDENE